MSDIIEIEVKNWEKYNPKLNQKHNIWFRLNNNFFQDQAIYVQNWCAKLLYLRILCACSMQSSCKVMLSSCQVRAELGLRKPNYFEALDALKSGGFIDFTFATNNTNKQYKQDNSRLRKKNVDAIASPDDQDFSLIKKNLDVIGMWKAQPWAPAVRHISEARKKKISVLLKKFPDESFWDDVFKRINGSGWLLGKIPGRDGRRFKITLDWLLNETNLTKIVEGNYNDAQSSKTFMEIKL